MENHRTEVVCLVFDKTTKIVSIITVSKELAKVKFFLGDIKEAWDSLSKEKWQLVICQIHYANLLATRWQQVALHPEYETGLEI